MNSSSRLLGSREAAMLLGVSRTYVNRLAKEGRLRATRVANSFVFAEADILAFQVERLRKAVHDPRVRVQRKAA